MVSSIVTDNIAALRKAPQTFESIYTIIKNRFTSETFGEWLENGEPKHMSYYELYEMSSPSQLLHMQVRAVQTANSSECFWRIQLTG